MQAEDPTLARDVARFFLTMSKDFSSANADNICSYLDDEVIVDIATGTPKMKFKQVLARDAACQSLKGAELKNYLNEFGLSDVHTEMPYLLPTLFGLNGSKPYLKLDEATQKAYAVAVNKQRVEQNKKPLACSMYNVVQAENAFKITLTCSTVHNFRVVLRRQEDGQFRLLQLVHSRP